MSRVSRVPAPVLILIAGVLWGTIGIFGKAADLNGMGWADVAFWRAFVTGVLFLAHAVVAEVTFPRGRDLAVTIGFGLVAVAVLYGSYQLAVLTGGAGLASLLLYSAPAFVALLAWLALHERLTWREVLGIAGTLSGVVLNGFAGALYIGSQLGPGPRDGLMTGLSRRTGRSIRLVRTLIELTVLAAGWALGGVVGVGTVFFAMLIGPVTQLFLPMVTVRLPSRVGEVDGEAA